METLDTLADALSTEIVYQHEMSEQGKQSVANLKSSFGTVVEIAEHLFAMIEKYQTLEDQINAAAEMYAETLKETNNG